MCRNAVDTCGGRFCLACLRRGFDVPSIERASSPQIELLTGKPSENLCPFRGGQLQPGGVLIKRGRRGRGCWSRLIESSGSMPPVWGFLSTVSTLPWTSPASSRGGPRFSATHRASLALVLEIGCRTPSMGQPVTSRDFHGTHLGLQGKEEAVAVHLSARWARLFR